MEFSNLHNTNPFRIVLNEENCAMMGVPDYCQIVTKPMNLTYIQTKVNQCHYETLQEFFADLELMIQNSFLYNSDPNNPYHIATKELRKQFKKMAKNLLASIQQQPSTAL
jgi:histone acetyltransferase